MTGYTAGQRVRRSLPFRLCPAGSQQSGKLKDLAYQEIGSRSRPTPEFGSPGIGEGVVGYERTDIL